MFKNESSISSVCSCNDASTTKLLGICPTTAHQFLTLYSAGVCIRPADIMSLFHATGSVHTAVGLFLLLVRRSGTHCPKTCGIRSVLWTVTDSHWRHFYFRSTNVFSSALEVCYENALYKFTFDIWHLTFDYIGHCVKRQSKYDKNSSRTNVLNVVTSPLSRHTVTWRHW